MNQPSNIPPCGNEGLAAGEGSECSLEAPARRLAVLVADDTPAFQKIIAHLLRRRGHDVTVAADGREAIEHYLSAKFDAIVLDVKMPFVDGLEVAREIRRREEGRQVHTNIVALTTHALAVDRDKCLAAGMDAYLTKPVDATKLIQLIENEPQEVEPKSPSAKHAHRKMNNGNSEFSADFEASIRRLGGDVELFQEFVTVLDEDSPGILQSLRDAVAERNGVDTERDAHSLRGLISNFGASKAVRVAEQLEEMGKNNTWEDVDNLLERLDAEMLRLSQALEVYRQESRPHPQ